VDPSGALNHPVRRRILRTLIASDRPLSLSELVAAAAPGASVSAVGYHARVLESSGAVGSTQAGGAAEDLYRAAEPDAETIALLDATRAADG
jgi:DNA-binding transcriptional regulator GbsR (MarR family)